MPAKPPRGPTGASGRGSTGSCILGKHSGTRRAAGTATSRRTIGFTRSQLYAIFRYNDATEVNLLGARKLMSKLVVPSSARSAQINPTTFENLNPWPEHGDAITNRGSVGSRPSTKFSSGVFVYMHVRESSMSPLASGM